MPAAHMHPVAILQHEPNQGPGFLSNCLREQGVPVRIYQAAQGQLPPDLAAHSGLVVLGSNRSVNDKLPWVADELELLREALALDLPVLGHCFGGQLLARALGARVHRNGCPNIGWSRLGVTPAARHLFGDDEPAELFNWHYETFEIPRGATRTLFGRHCLNKGFALGRHLGFQAHLEVTEESVRDWCRESRHELLHPRGPAMQSEAELLRDLGRRTVRLHGVARRVYRHWIQGLQHQQQQPAGTAAAPLAYAR